MTANLIWQLREWLTLDEAAEALSDSVGGQGVSVADVLSLALEGHLKLSVNLPGTTAACYEENQTDGPTRRAHLNGVWDLPMVGSGRRQVEHQYHWQRGLPFISMEDSPGAFVQRDGLTCRVPPDPGASGFSPRVASALPPDAVIVVRTAELEEVRKTLVRIKVEASREAFTPAVVSVAPQDRVDGADKPVAARERATLLTIIAALAKEAKIDVSKASKAGVTISNLISAMGQEVAPNTVARHLRSLAKIFPELENDPID